MAYTSTCLTARHAFAQHATPPRPNADVPLLLPLLQQTGHEVRAPQTETGPSTPATMMVAGAEAEVVLEVVVRVRQQQDVETEGRGEVDEDRRCRP